MLPDHEPTAVAVAALAWDATIAAVTVTALTTGRVLHTLATIARLSPDPN